MLSTYAGVVLLGVFLGLLGGALAHVKWMLQLGKTSAAQGKSPSMSKKSQRLRIALMFLSVALGGAAGFVVALIGFDKHLGLSTIIAASVLSGLSIGFLVRFLRGV